MKQPYVGRSILEALHKAVNICLFSRNLARFAWDNRKKMIYSCVCTPPCISSPNQKCESLLVALGFNMVSLQLGQLGPLALKNSSTPSLYWCLTHSNLCISNDSEQSVATTIYFVALSSGSAYGNHSFIWLAWLYNTIHESLNIFWKIYRNKQMVAASLALGVSFWSPVKPESAK